jgi:cell division transport system permease protein
MLITFCIFLLIDNIVDNYKNKISRDYSIVLVATNPIKKESLNELAGIKVENIQLYQMIKIIENIKSNLSDNSIEF